MPPFREPPTDAERDRAIGVLLGTAVGDALGAAGDSGPPGLWTGNTAMAIAIAELATTSSDLQGEKRRDEIVERWSWWGRTATDVDPQTRKVLDAAAQNEIRANAARAAATAWSQSGQPATNASLARTAPVALANLQDEWTTALVARKVSALTHTEPDAVDACVLWCLAIRHAVWTGQLDVRIGLGRLPSERRALWEARIADTEKSRPADFAEGNSGVVAALQGAWSAIDAIPVPETDPASGVFAADHFRLALQAAVRAGGDTAAVGAIAGALLGAAYGASAVPAQWRLGLKGWPGLNTRLLVALVDKILNEGDPQRFDYTYLSHRKHPQSQRHPHDSGVWIGSAPALKALPGGVDAVISLCQVADGDIPPGVRHLDVRLIEGLSDTILDFVLLDTVRIIEHLRNQGATVFVHGLCGHSRTPAVAALYGARRTGIDVYRSLSDVCVLLPEADLSPTLRTALGRLHPSKGNE